MSLIGMAMAHRSPIPFAASPRLKTANRNPARARWAATGNLKEEADSSQSTLTGKARLSV